MLISEEHMHIWIVIVSGMIGTIDVILFIATQLRELPAEPQRFIDFQIKLTLFTARRSSLTLWANLWLKIKW